MWMRELRALLLTKKKLTLEQVDQLRALTADIQRSWVQLTGTPVIPKVHMLTHCVEFASLHRYLGAMSESTMESCHATSNRLIAYNHFNVGKDLNEKLRRTQVSQTLSAIQPVLKKMKSY
jgi:hypothetical protein